ncbi:hypothetical protein RJ639_044481 [Escallonia herrerae]|uniref:Integrase catalytic domain-containing protein n=1 Tax=Escallonia herrerae TaxID=1293975 RepID=A0AA89B119_9ASTE|nr:hypothetical protein RJ639_044481 [Escallonia herrerae]
MKNPMVKGDIRDPGGMKRTILKLILPETLTPIQAVNERSATLMPQLSLDDHSQRKSTSFQLLRISRCLHGPKKSLKSYYARFNSGKLLIDHLDSGVTFAAMARGVRPGTPLQFSLNKRPPENMSDLLDRVEKYLWAEEDSTSSHQEENHSGQKRRDLRKKKSTQNGGRNPPQRANEAPPKDPPVINTISGGPSAGGLSSSSWKAYARQVNLTQGPPKRAKAPASLEFNDLDLEGVSLPHDDTFVITLRIDAFQVKRILIDIGSSADILFEDAFLQMGISEDRVKPITSPLYGFTGASAPVRGIAPLTVIIGEAPQQATHTLDFLIVKVKSSYNGILGRTGLNRLQAVASTYHLLMKFPTPRGVGFIKGDQTLARRCYVASCRPEKTLSIDDQRDETTARCAEPVEALIHHFSTIPRQAPIPLSTLSSPIPFVMWGMDMLGPFPPATAQHKFVIVAIDYFTKWVEAEALATITEKKCEEFFWQAVFCRFGIPRVLITDNGKQFDNPTFRAFCSNLSTEQRFTSVAHPQTNGQTEVTNQTLLQRIKKKLDGVKGL